MPIEFTCPYCQQRTLVDDQYLGHSGPCATCGKAVHVPYVVGSHTSPSAPRRAAGGAAAASLIGWVTRRLWVMTIVLLGLLVAGSLLALIVLVVFPAVQVVHQGNMRSASAANLQKIVTALRAYASDHGSYPPAYTTDDSGQRMHSWRVLILPYLGEQSLYERYRFDEPWDGPSNMELVAWMPNVYASPADAHAQLGGETSYMVVVGPATAFPTTQTRRPQDLVDGPDETLLVAEVVASGIVWHQPQDLDARQMTFQINARPGAEIGSAHPGGAHVALASGRVHFLTSDALPVEVEALTTIDAGDLPPSEIVERR